MAACNSTLPFPSHADLEFALAFYRNGLRILQTAASKSPAHAPEQRIWRIVLARFQAVIDDVLLLLALA